MIEDSIVLKGTQIVIPTKKHEAVLNLIHEGHLGLNKCKLRAKDTVKLIISKYGWPETLISDNGPCYTSEVFTSLMKDYSVNCITSSPHYP